MNVSKDIPTPENDRFTDLMIGQDDASHLLSLDRFSRDLERRLTVATEQLAASRAETVQAELKARRAKKQLAPLYEQLRVAREALQRMDDAGGNYCDLINAGDAAREALAQTAGTP